MNWDLNHGAVVLLDLHRPTSMLTGDRRSIISSSIIHSPGSAMTVTRLGSPVEYGLLLLAPPDTGER